LDCTVGKTNSHEYPTSNAATRQTPSLEYRGIEVDIDVPSKKHTFFRCMDPAESSETGGVYRFFDRGDKSANDSAFQFAGDF
jgi:hypothetical protein